MIEAQKTPSETYERIFIICGYIHGPSVYFYDIDERYFYDVVEEILNFQRQNRQIIMIKKAILPYFFIQQRIGSQPHHLR